MPFQLNLDGCRIKFLRKYMGLLPAMRSVKEVLYPRGKKRTDWEVLEQTVSQELGSQEVIRCYGDCGFPGEADGRACVLESLF